MFLNFPHPSPDPQLNGWFVEPNGRLLWSEFHILKDLLSWGQDLGIGHSRWFLLLICLVSFLGAEVRQESQKSLCRHLVCRDRVNAFGRDLASVGYFGARILMGQLLIVIRLYALLVVLGRKFIVDVAYERDAHLGRIVAPEHVADEVGLDLHLYHLESTA